MRNAPAGSQRFYGQLSKIAHPETPALLLNFLSAWDAREHQLGISHVPRFVPRLANHLLLIHVWLLFEFAREAVLLYSDVFGEQEALDRAAFEVSRAAWSLEECGLRFDAGDAEEPS